MIDPHMILEGFSAESWHQFLDLFSRPSDGRGWLLILVDESHRIQLAFHSKDQTFAFMDHEQRNIENAIQIGYGCTELQYEVARLARRTHARRVWVLPLGACSELWDEHARRYSDDDYLTQMLGLLKVWQMMVRKGRAMAWPGLPKLIPGKEALIRALDIALPPQHTFVLCLWSDDKLATGLVVARSGQAISHVLGVQKIVEWSGLLAGDMARDCRFIERGIEQHLPPVHMGVYAEYQQFKELIRNNEHGAWTKAISLRQVIIHPAPAYVGVAMGADIARAVAAKSKDLLYGVDALKPLAMIASRMRGQIHRIGSVNQTLGFDPLQSLANLLEEDL